VGDVNVAGKQVDVYLLHIDPPYKRAGHYVGSTERHVDARFAEHMNGGGSGLTRAALNAGCTLIVVRIWHDVDASIEFVIKSRAEGPTLCPLCNPEGWDRLANYDEKESSNE
jgi:hypothetical protein